MRQPFLHAHATHPDWRMALALAAAQLDAQRAARAGGFEPTLGFLYITEAYAPEAEALLADAQARWPGVQFAGSVGVGVAACGVEYVDEPALVLMLTTLPREQFTVFSGRQPLGAAQAHTALVHADPATPELPALIAELAERTDTGYLFGGLASSRGRTVQFAGQGEAAVVEGGLSGVAFAAPVRLLSRVTQGCQPIGPTRHVTRSERNVLLALDGEPALPQLLADLGVSLDRPREALHRLRGTLVGLTDAGDDARGRGGQFGADTRVRHLVGIDPGAEAVAIADAVEEGQQVAFCTRHAEAARRDLVRICAELRDEVEDAPLLGALYISCNGRGGAHFGAPSAELKIVQHALGEVPLVGFFAAGEIARRHLYGYTGVLTVFVGE